MHSKSNYSTKSYTYDKLCNLQRNPVDGQSLRQCLHDTARPGHHVDRRADVAQLGESRQESQLLQIRICHACTGERSPHLTTCLVE